MIDFQSMGPDERVKWYVSAYAYLLLEKGRDKTFVSAYESDLVDILNAVWEFMSEDEKEACASTCSVGESVGRVFSRESQGSEAGFGLFVCRT